MAPTLCSPEAFASLSFPSIDIRSVYASQVIGFPIEDAAQIPNFGFYPSGTVDFCNVTIVYSHPGEEDYPIAFEAWLPDHDSWNERLIASGGSGFAAGKFSDTYRFMSGLINEGYASFTTDGGAPNVTNFEFALKEKGVLDEVSLRNWGSVAIGEMVRLNSELAWVPG
jgi:feruloyl esterase